MVKITELAGLECRVHISRYVIAKSDERKYVQRRIMLEIVIPAGPSLSRIALRKSRQHVICIL